MSVSIPAELYESIRQAYGGKRWLFESTGGKPLNINNIGHQVRKAAQRIGMTNYTPHMLRHSRATDLLLRKSQSLKAVSKYLGHSSVAVTAQMYIHDQVNVSELFMMDIVMRSSIEPYYDWVLGMKTTSNPCPDCV